MIASLQEAHASDSEKYSCEATSHLLEQLILIWWARLHTPLAQLAEATGLNPVHVSVRNRGGVRWNSGSSPHLVGVRRMSGNTL